jgi:microcystin-dependent protein
MTAITETSTWETGITQWASDGPLDGGADSVDQLPIRQLANRTQFLKALVEEVRDMIVPVGTILMLPYGTAPTGFLKANGAAVSRTTYARLFAAIGTTYGLGDGALTFNLPDVRGEFLRCLDDSRGVDAGRALGTAQASAVKVHTHFLPTVAGDGTTYWALRDSFDAQSGITTTSARNSIPQSGAGSLYTLDDTEVHPSLGPDTRPRNIAMLAVIRI